MNLTCTHPEISAPAGAVRQLPQPAPDAPTRRDWVPIRTLGPRHRGRIARHLTALDGRSRYLRFGFPATDAQIARYVDTIDFENDEAFGIFNRHLELIAMAHLAHRSAEPGRGQPASSEFGVSVLPGARRRGFGSRLFENAMLHTRNRGIQMMLIHALSENTPMLNIARRAGATVERDGSESQARLRLPPGSFASHIDALIGERAAEVDYQWKRHARHTVELSETGQTVRPDPEQGMESTGTGR